MIIYVVQIDGRVYPEASTSLKHACEIAGLSYRSVQAKFNKALERVCVAKADNIVVITRCALVKQTGKANSINGGYKIHQFSDGTVMRVKKGI